MILLKKQEKYYKNNCFFTFYISLCRFSRFHKFVRIQMLDKGLLELSGKMALIAKFIVIIKYF